MIFLLLLELQNIFLSDSQCLWKIYNTTGFSQQESVRGEEVKIFLPHDWLFTTISSSWPDSGDRQACIYTHCCVISALIIFGSVFILCFYQMSLPPSLCCPLGLPAKIFGMTFYHCLVGWFCCLFSLSFVVLWALLMTNVSYFLF